MKKETKNRKSRWVKALIAMTAILSESLLVGLFIYIIKTPKLENTTSIEVNGKTVDELVCDDMVIIPGNTESYEVTIKNRLADQYHILVEYKGSEDIPLYKYIETSIESSNCSFNKELNDVVNKGYQSVGYETITKDEGVKFIVSYHFSNEIANDLINPFTLKLAFKIEH